MTNDKSLKDKAIKIKDKDYILVADRVIYFNDTYQNGSITTELISDPESDLVIVKATVVPDVEVTARKFTGYSQAIKGDGFINKTAALENCETSAIGRALGSMGIGVLDAIASVDEINKAQGSSGERPFKGLSEKQKEWIYGEAKKATGLELAEDVEAWVKELTGTDFDKIPGYRCKNIVDRIRSEGEAEAKIPAELDLDKEEIPY